MIPPVAGKATPSAKAAPSPAQPQGHAPKVTPSPAGAPEPKAAVTLDAPKIKPTAPGAAESATHEAAAIPLRKRIKVAVRGFVIQLLWDLALLAWGYLMDKLSQKIEAIVVERMIKSKMAELEPEIQVRLNNQAPRLAALQLDNPGRPVYGNISVLIHEYRMFDDDDETLLDITVELTDVTIAAEPQKAQTHERYYTGIKWINQAPHDLIRVTFPMELLPLGDDALRDFLDQRISELEKGEPERSSTPEAVISSQRERDRLAEQRRKLNQPLPVAVFCGRGLVSALLQPPLNPRLMELRSPCRVVVTCMVIGPERPGHPPPEGHGRRAAHPDSATGLPVDVR
jgi:hypothetical protein